MSQYKPYPAYKDSGVEWLGKVPEHWTLGPYKSLIQIENGADYKEVEVAEGFPVIGSGGIFAYASKKMYEGESVLLGRKGTIDRPLYVNGPFWTVDTMYWSILKKGACGRFAYYVATTIPFDMYSTNTALPSMTKSVLGAHQIAFPDISEQKIIAAHLDRETTRIDALVAKKTRFIELLREKRQALITHAVTKGLDPNVTMKDSGVEWLGEVPEHWVIRPLKQLARLDGGAGFPDDEQGIKDAPIPFFKVADLANGMSRAENYITAETADKLRAKIFPAGTIAFAKVGAALLLNRRVLMPLAGCTDNNMMVAIPHGVLGIWLHAILSCYDMAWLVNPGAVPSVNQEQVGNIKIPVPLVAEQRLIVAGLKSDTMSIDALVVKTEQSIQLLKERRAALITAAVTGQIDLREPIHA